MEPQHQVKVVVGPSKTHTKQHHVKVTYCLGITWEVIHHAHMDLEQQGVKLDPYSDFIYKKYMLL